MREILFRGKRTDSGEWYFGYYHVTHGTPAIFKKTEIDPREDYAFVDPSTVGEYTGLTDRNGRKIFEGDIVRCYYSNISPFTDEIEPYEKEVLIDDILRSEVIGWIDCADELEIIGNIYDNPER